MKTVVFFAPCPSCGAGCRWTQQQQHAADDARVQSADFDVTCPCSP